MPAADAESGPHQLFLDITRTATTPREGGKRNRDGRLSAPAAVTPLPRAPRPVASQPANAVSTVMRGRLAQPSRVDASSQRALRSELAQEVNTFMSQSYAESTKTKAVLSIKRYMQWCQMTNLYPHENREGISDMELAMYMAWLARTVSAAVAEKYVCMGVRLVHEALGFSWVPPKQRFLARLTIRGVKSAQKTVMPKRKLPVTVQLLHAIHDTVNYSTVNGRAFWAACTTLFFCFLRKAHVTMKTVVDKQTMLLSDLRAHGTRVIVSIRHTKTRQHNSGLGSDTLQYLLPQIEDSVLCPTAALSQYVQVAEPYLHPREPLFIQVTTRRDGTTVVSPLKYAAFLYTLKACIKKAGLDPALYAGQSFRPGGATFALDAGVPPAVTRAMGDWKSNVWEDYVSATAKLRENAAFSLAMAVQLAEAADSPILY
jgi:hypothetical protein